MSHHSYTTCIHYGSGQFMFQRPTRVDAVIFVQGSPSGQILRVGNQDVRYPDKPVAQAGITVFVLPEWQPAEEGTNPYPLTPAWYLELTEVW